MASIFAVVYVKDVYLAHIYLVWCWRWLCPHGVRKWKLKDCPLKMVSNLFWIYDLRMTDFYFAQLWTKRACCWMTLNPKENKNPNNSGPTAATVTNSWWGDSGCFGPCLYAQNGSGVCSMLAVAMTQTLISTFEQPCGRLMQIDGYWLIDMCHWQQGSDILIWLSLQ